jgi:spermidine synthase
MVLDLVLLFAFQSIHGYLFSWLGLLVASFMAGAACGATIVTERLDRIKDGYGALMRIELAIVCFSVACPFAFLAVRAYPGSPNVVLFRMLFLAISFTCGLLIGAQFPLANQLYPGSRAGLSRTAGLLYASDLLGGWLGGILGAVVLLPLLGLVGTCITVGLLKLTSWVVLATQPNKSL